MDDLPISAQLTIAQDPDADALLSADPFALLMGMLLDQQFPMERAFAGPLKISQRFGTVDPGAIAAADPDTFADLQPTRRRFTATAGRWPVGSRRWPTSWSTNTAGMPLPSGPMLPPAPNSSRDCALSQVLGTESEIFLALLAKQLGVAPKGWTKAAGDYAKRYRSVADVVDADSLQLGPRFQEGRKGGREGQG